MKINQNKLVILQYKLQVKNENGKLEVWEETTNEQPLRYLHGLGMMLPKFEENLEGMQEGDKFEFMIGVDDAYGKREEANIIKMPKKEFAEDGFFEEQHIEAGSIVPVRDNEGNQFYVEVVSVDDDSITLDGNHPLAGEDLYFSGHIVSVTQPTDEELQEMMHPKHHCCGDCGDEGCSGGCDGGCSGCH